MKVPGLRPSGDKVGGIVYFGRMLDKIRLRAAGKLPADYNYGTGDWSCFTARCVRFLRVDFEELERKVVDGITDAEALEWCFQNGRHPSPEEVEIWNEFITKRGWRDGGSDQLQQTKKDHGFGGRDDIQTWFDFHRADEESDSKPLQEGVQFPEGIRKAQPGDAGDIARLSESLGYPAKVSEIQSRLASLAYSPADLAIVAVDKDQVTGWLQAHSATILESGFRVEITGLVVDPNGRRAGIGRKLVSAAETWSRQLGSEVIVVRSNIQRLESHQFYPALGYQETKTQKVYRKVGRVSG